MAERKDKKLSITNGSMCSNCSAPEDSASGYKLSACSRCGLVAYCSKDCQRAHWKASHKQHCIAKADRTPNRQNALQVKITVSNEHSLNTAMEKCAICQDLLSESPVCTLPCAHTFHSTCVAELQKYGVEQACPLCRVPLVSGPEKITE